MAEDLAEHREHWLVITNWAIWSRLRRGKSWVFPDKAERKAAEIQPGDVAVVYITRDGSPIDSSALVGVIEFAGKLTRATGSGYLDQLYPWRARVKFLDQKEPVPFPPLVRKLGFISNKKQWGLHFKGQSLRWLSEDDYDVLTAAIEE